MSRQKATLLASPKAHQPCACSSSGKSRTRDANLTDFVMQALAVYGDEPFRCIGFILPRGKSGFEAFDGADRSRGLFPTQKEAADAVTRAAGGVQ